MFEKKYKVLFLDLDGTIIETLSGKTFPQGIWDMKWKNGIFDAIKSLNPDALSIVSNQGGIEKSIVKENDFVTKIEYVACCLRAYNNIPCDYNYCASNDVSNKLRKPNTGMLERSIYFLQSNFCFSFGIISPSDCLMVGDASGLEGQFSDSDKKTAENFGCDYMDVNEFIKKYSV